MNTPRNDCRTLFRNSNPDKDSFYGSLKLSDADRKSLVSAKAEIRKAIRIGFEFLKTVQKRSDLKTLSTPRFAQQGSFVYGTLNNPAYPPEQQLDLDYGVYLPFSDLADGKAPKQITIAFFTIVEEILENHIENNRKNQWALKKKDTCVRIVINSRMHIDLPLYGCPDKEMSRVVEAANEKMASLKNRTADQLYADFERIDSKFIHLAHRKKGWMVSDPLVVRDWVEKVDHAFGVGNHFKDVCRYLKAWRDEVPEWRDGGGPSSVLCLALSAELYSTDKDGVHAQLAEVINGLSARLSYPVTIPAPGQPTDEEDLLERVSSTELYDFKSKFQTLAQQYNEALESEDTCTCNQILVQVFGKRFPHRPDDIKQKKKADIVREAPAVITAAKIPATTTSG